MTNVIEDITVLPFRCDSATCSESLSMRSYTSGTRILVSTIERISWKETFWKLDATSMIDDVRRPKRDLEHERRGRRSRDRGSEGGQV